jgi:quinol monooxygenase YgiN
MAGVTVVCTFRVKKGKEKEFEGLLKIHWPKLKELGLATAKPAINYRGADREGNPIFFEIFEWRDQKAVEEAHNNPKVMQIWEPMGACVEDRGGAPKMEFVDAKQLNLFGSK